MYTRKGERENGQEGMMRAEDPDSNTLHFYSEQKLKEYDLAVRS